MAVRTARRGRGVDIPRVELPEAEAPAGGSEAAGDAAAMAGWRRLAHSRQRVMPLLVLSMALAVLLLGFAGLHDWREGNSLNALVALAAAALLIVLAWLTARRLYRSLTILASAAEEVGRQHGLLVASEAEARAARMEADAASRMKSEFIAMMSHELRTPLNAIIGFSQLLIHDLGDAAPVDKNRSSGYARDIYDSSAHLLDIINNILDLSKIEAGKYEIRPEPVHVDAVAGAASRMVEGRAAVARVQLTTRMEYGGLVWADRRALTQVLINLLSNGAKFNRPGGRVELCVAEEGSDRIRFSVADTGIGMRPEDIPTALSRFGQVDASLSRQHEGTGLGLSIVGMLLELHGSQVAITSEPGVGTTVSFVLAKAGEALMPPVGLALTAS
jgi:signal transduction histidine kinase